MDEVFLRTGKVGILLMDSGLKLGAVEEAYKQELLELFALHLLVIADWKHQEEHQTKGHCLVQIGEELSQASNS